ncbi:hypothetical protein ACFO5K_04515 [Nocardia halotolerans]|uniref:Uncharacterized protein n=1 Tax=Nocardia halotolerans TaxID=1755878 RepID=A0ABV8VCW9_9NOCA
MSRPIPDCCDIEIIEYADTDDRSGAAGVVRPQEIRINGKPVLSPKDNPVVIHELAIGGDDVVKVTLTVFARLVKIGLETKTDETVSLEPSADALRLGGHS